MINKDKKSKYFVFFSYEYNSIREYLEEMALKGWLLKSIMAVSYTHLLMKFITIIKGNEE